MALVLALTACGSGERGAGPSPTEPSATSVPAASADAFYQQKIAWGSCGGFGVEVPEELAGRVDCGRIAVPIDYDAPGGRQASLAVLRLKAAGERIGSILTNPGGPGGSGVEFAAGQLRSWSALELAERFDMIGFDPRGIGRSTPAFVCLSGPEQDALRAAPFKPGTPQGVADQEKDARDFAETCRAKLGDDVLAHAGTVDVVRDMDVLRAVLGDEKLNYIGYSYGTHIGSVYAEKFPEKVRAMVLDGAVDPDEDRVDKIVRQGAGFQQAFTRFAQNCATRPDCPVGTDPKKANDRYRALLAPLQKRAAPTSDGRPLSFVDAQTGTLQALYQQSYWRYLREGLTQLAGGDGGRLLALADLYLGRNVDGSYTGEQDAFTVVRCVDGVQDKDRANANRLDVEYRKAAPFLDDGTGTGIGPLTSCAFWPVPNTDRPHRVSAPGVPRTVVVSTTEDPATPYQAGVSLARQLGASLITVTGVQHTSSLRGSRCVDEPITRYFIDGTTPDESLRC